MRENFTRILYLLSFSSVVAAIIYFFASNWGGFDRFQKIGLSVGLFLLFYLLAFVVSKRIENHPFLGKWFMVTGSITFGVTVALLGQIYNSHADSYMLFFIWLIPTTLFAVVTKYQPFYVTSLILINLTLWFYTYPSQGVFSRSSNDHFFIFLIFAIVNFLIFIGSYRKIIPSPIVKGISFSIAHLIMVFLSIYLLFDTYGFVLNFIYGPLLLASIYYLSKKDEKMLTILSGIALSLYAIVKYFELAINFSALFYFGGMVFAGFLVIGTLKLVKMITTMDGTHAKTRHFLKNCLLVFATLIASFIGSFSTLGFISLLADNAAPYIIYFVAILGFIGFPLYKETLEPAIRLTLISIGFLMACIISTEMHPIFATVLLGVVGYSWFRTKTSGLKFLLYFIANGLVFYLLYQHIFEQFLTSINDVSWLFIIMASLNFFVFLLKGFIDTVAVKNSLVYALLPLLALTFYGDIGELNYVVHNILFFTITLFVLLKAKAMSNTFEYRVASVFWYVFLLLKYYDFGWKLLHKSMALFIIGGVLFTVAVLLDRKNKYPAQPTNFVLFRWKWIAAIIALQLLITGVQIGKSELLLSQGEMVKLRLEPVDPRSLIQGDYVIVNYDISTIDIEGYDRLGKIDVLLRENQDGIYEYGGIYKSSNGFNQPYIAQEGDVFITGKHVGYNRIQYGIENYFIEEGTGAEVERTMRHAYVKVSKSGDAILISISK
ncbi:DUF2157 domain-containing protein [Anaerobacillus alkaliphilus]|uniref:DUF2157 domain-containing protein n=1 Tax=Anaerobacillus alkaliphilus TaxID=1548597 RepID=A0A4Q0VNJ0_9BACI|nr:GDYXXLXY domain-containing protein [Anaerobacillus alkaliphilus]RXI96392.1 DUF2157 domain-containing protein [Anaerobacillus alkaliphilus]